MAVARLTTLSAAQRAALPRHAAAWIARALAARPADRARMERGIRGYYTLAGLPPPTQIVWVASPLAAVTAGPLAAHALAQLRGVAVDTRVSGTLGGAVNRVVLTAANGAVALAARGAVNRVVLTAANGAVALAARDVVDDAAGNAVNAAVRGEVHRVVDSAVVGAVDRTVNVAVADAVDRAVRAVTNDAVGDAVHDAVVDAVADAMNATVGDATSIAVRDATAAPTAHLAAGARAAVRDHWSAYLGGAFWAAWPAAYGTFYRDICGLDLAPEALRAAEDATEGGWWWPHAEFAVVSDRPTTLARDAAGRLHAAAGPAAGWGDGFGIWAWHGTVVPRAWLATPGALTPAGALAEANVERRRAACEILGWSAILDALPHRVLDADPDPAIGTLLAVDLPDAPDTRYVRARCGTGRTIYYRTSRDARTALQAAELSYGLASGAYRPEVRT